MSHSFNCIPQEIQDYQHWIIWRYEDTDGPKPTKVPYDAKAFRYASTTDASTWATFSEAVAMYERGGCDGIGFVFAESDPFCGIDLDAPRDQEIWNTQLKIAQAFNGTYSELSPSGEGLHIIAKGTVRSGRKRGCVELYDKARFFTFTGNVHNNAPITEQQHFVSILWHELGGKLEQRAITGDVVEKSSDEEILAAAINAANGDKFAKLYAGDWRGEYPSPSEADQALMNFLAFYCEHRIQLMRLFRASGLGQRDKAKRDDYLAYTINRAFDQKLPPIDIDFLRNEANAVIAAAQQEKSARSLTVEQSAHNGQVVGSNPTGHTICLDERIPPQAEITPPSGMVGETAQFIYNAAVRPVPEIAIAAAISLFAGICGRSFNISGTGLNMYVLLLAPTGTGKEGAANGINRLMQHIATGGITENGLQGFPTCKEFIGPGEISSGQALAKQFDVQRSFLSIVGEFGLTMQRLAHPRANASDVMLKKMLLHLYNKSGNNDILDPTIYSDKTKNVAEVKSPAFSMLGESTPATYYGSVDETIIADGLLPRFVAIEYHGARPPINRAGIDHVPTIDFVSRLSDMIEVSLKLNSTNTAINVAETDEAAALLDDINTYADARINGNHDSEVVRHLWNRAHLNTLKLAALVAVGCTDYRAEQIVPTITVEHVEWAFRVVRRTCDNITRKFELGEVGGNSEETKQVKDVVRVVRDYLTLPFEDCAKYGGKRKQHDDKVVPYTYIQRRLATLAAFKNDRIGATGAIKRTIQLLCESGDLVEMGYKQTSDTYGKGGKAYMVGDTSRFFG